MFARAHFPEASGRGTREREVLGGGRVGGRPVVRTSARAPEMAGSVRVTVWRCHCPCEAVTQAPHMGVRDDAFGEITKGVPYVSTSCASICDWRARITKGN